MGQTPFPQPPAHKQGGYSEEEGDGTRFMTQILEPAQISGQMEASELRDLENVDLMFAQNGRRRASARARACEEEGVRARRLEDGPRTMSTRAVRHVTPDQTR